MDQVMRAIIPRTKQGEMGCRKAKEMELGKLKETKVYKVVRDEGQFHISSNWELGMK